MRGTVAVSSVAFSGARGTVAAGSLSSVGGGEGDAKVTARFLRGAPCSEADDDEEDDDGASGGGDTVVVSAASSFPTMGVGGPRETCFASVERQEDLSGGDGEGDDDDDVETDNRLAKL